LNKGSGLFCLVKLASIHFYWVYICWSPESKERE
jgi:hypothetical protein